MQSGGGEGWGEAESSSLESMCVACGGIERCQPDALVPLPSLLLLLSPKYCLCSTGNHSLLQSACQPEAGTPYPVQTSPSARPQACVCPYVCTPARTLRMCEHTRPVPARYVHRLRSPPSLSVDTPIYERSYIHIYLASSTPTSLARSCHFTQAVRRVCSAIAVVWATLLTINRFICLNRRQVSEPPDTGSRLQIAIAAIRWEFVALVWPI